MQRVPVEAMRAKLKPKLKELLPPFVTEQDLEQAVERCVVYCDVVWQAYGADRFELTLTGLGEQALGDAERPES